MQALALNQLMSIVALKQPSRITDLLLVDFYIFGHFFPNYPPIFRIVPIKHPPPNFEKIFSVLHVTAHHANFPCRCAEVT